MFILAGFAIVVFTLDQSSKHAAESRAVVPGTRRNRVVNLRCVRNRNRHYQRAGVHAALALLWLLAITSATLLRAQGVWFQSPVAVAGLGCALGGAAGNLLDIIRRKYVLDFVDLGWWPIFNLADVSIVGGLALAFWR